MGADGTRGGVTDRLLRTCTTRIDIGGVPAGSGFFAAPGLVVTCLHVLEGLDLTSPDALAAIKICDLEGRSYAVAAVPDRSEDDDIAVLRLEQADMHPCVLLLAGLNTYDDVLTFGFTRRHSEGLVRTLIAEGTTGNDRLQALSKGQVEQGMSGGPVLNLRTGGVCGVVSLTRDESGDLGGYAIPIERLTLLAPTLMRQNRGYHEMYPEWFDLLPDLSRSMLLDARAGLTRGEGFSALFVVTVGRDGHDWEVGATLHRPGAEPEQIPTQEVDLNTVRDKVARLFRDWASRGRTDPRAVAPGRYEPSEELRLLGSILFTAVLPGAVGERFCELAQGRERLELALYFTRDIRPEVAEIPWEQLHVALPNDVPLARAENIAVVRVRRPEPREAESPRRRHVSALVVGVNPPEAQAGWEIGQMLSDAEHLSARLEGLSLTALEMPTAEVLRRELARGSFHIVHYIGFGGYHGGADHIALPSAGGYDYLDSEMFDALLAVRRPTVVVLQEIESRQEPRFGDQPGRAVPADLSVFARQLLERGSDGVIGYQFPVPAWLSMRFNSGLYERLAEGESLEMAVQQARSDVWGHDPSLHAFLSPAVFVSRPGELRLTAPAAAMATTPRVGMLAGHA